MDFFTTLEIPFLRGSSVLSPVQPVCAKISSAHVSPVGIMNTFLPLGWKQKLVCVVTAAFWDDVRPQPVQGPQLWEGLGSNGPRESSTAHCVGRITSYDRIPSLKD